MSGYGEMLKVLHVTPSMSPSWGGPAVVVSELTSELVRQGVECEIVTTHGYRVGTGQLPARNVPVASFATELPARFWTGYSGKLLRFLMDGAGRFDLVHVHEIWHFPAFIAFFAARKYKLPYVVTIHGELSDWGLRQKALKKRLYRLCVLDRMLQGAGTIHAITNAEKEQVLKLGFENPVQVIPNGINPASFEVLPGPSRLLHRFPGLNGKRVILFLGRLHPKKGLDILARSFSTVARRFEDVMLLVAGPDKFGTREHMESILRSNGVLDRTVFTGLLTGEDKLAAMSCADLFVLPSHSDVLGIAVMEAMAARLPVVITSACEFPEVSENGAGLVVDVNEEAVAGAIGRLLSDADLCGHMGQRGHKLVAERFTWQATADTMIDLYKGLVT